MFFYTGNTIIAVLIGLLLPAVQFTGGL